MSNLSNPIEYLKKQAKKLLAGVKGADPEACDRARKVYQDGKDVPNAKLCESFGLMRAQHVVAVEHSYPSWDALSKSSSLELHLAITMVRMPDLNSFGIGIFDKGRGKTLGEREAELAMSRGKLRNSLESIEATICWLEEHVSPTKAIMTSRSSYGIKHIVEQDLGYIANGVFIAAAVIAGYKYEIQRGGPNVLFAMSRGSLNKVMRRQRQDPKTWGWMRRSTADQQASA